MLTLYEKASKTIAVSSVIYAFDQICNKDGVEGVTHQTLMAIHQRIQDSQVLNIGQNSSQHNIAMITTLDTQDVEMVCRPVELGWPFRYTWLAIASEDCGTTWSIVAGESALAGKRPE
eukprot:574660-Prymnesium_polylepis.1